MKIAIIIMVFFLIWLPLWKILDFYARKLLKKLDTPENRAKELEASIENLSIEIAVKKAEMERQVAELEKIKLKLTLGE